MADFKTALQALGRGDLGYEAVAENVTKLMKMKPAASIRLLGDLDTAFSQHQIDSATYERLRQLITTQVTSPGLYTATGAGSATRPPADRTVLQAPTSATGGEAAIGPGSILKERFALDEVLGIGGMGIVYKGRDLIKVEAKDRNPFVALKVLNEDFKQHPDAFISLQREASRQQKLAHPNIATVYDFDRTSGGTVFLTMELLEGTPLNEFIKKELAGPKGLPFDKAFPMIKGLGQALVYAHERKIVHSDFKPGNCYVIRDGTMKVLDFGIARAVKNPNQAEGDKTLFDPAKLGALTPAYASCEMMEGEEPDTRDDIYALACVAYELLTGRHPFNKIPANTAHANKLVPAPIKGLTRRQMRGLLRGLAFKRNDRSQNVTEFLRELEGRTSPLRNPIIMVPALVAAIAVIGVFPTLNYLHDRDLDARIASARSGDPATVDAVLGGLGDLDDVDRNQVLVAAREAILDHFAARIAASVDPAAGRYDFTTAASVLAQANSIDAYRDSTRLRELQNTLAEARAQYLNDLNGRFTTALETGALLDIAGADDVHDVLGLIRTVEPAYNPSGLPGTYAEAIEAALTANDFDRAQALSDAGLALMPGHVTLVNLTDRIAGAREQVTRDAEIARLLASIGPTDRRFTTLDEFLTAGPAITALAEIDPQHALLEQFKQRMEPLVDAELGRLDRGASWATSPLLAADLGALLNAVGLRRLNLDVIEKRAQFETQISGMVTAIADASVANDVARAQQQLAALEAFAGASPRAVLAGQQVANLRARQARAAPATAPDANFERGYAQLVEQLPGLSDAPATLAALNGYAALAAAQPADARLPGVRDDLVARVVTVAPALADSDGVDPAVLFVQQAMTAMPDAPGLVAALTSLESGRADAQRGEQQRFIDEQKQQVAALLADARFDRDWHSALLVAFTAVEDLVSGDDPWLATTRQSIAERYLARAALMRDAQRFAEGLSLVERAAAFVPEHPDIGPTRANIAAAENDFNARDRAQRRLDSLEALKQTFLRQAEARDANAAARTFAQLRDALPAGDPFIATQAPAALGRAYSRLASSRAQSEDFAGALQLAREGFTIHPASVELQQQVRDYNVRGTRQDIDNRLREASAEDLAALFDRIDQFKVLDPVEYNREQERWAQLVATQMNTLALADTSAFNTALARARDVFAGSPIIASLAPATVTPSAPSVFGDAIQRAMDGALLGQARDLLNRASESEPEHPDIVRLKSLYNSQLREARALYEEYKTAYSARDYTRADGIIDDALALWRDSGTFQQEKARVASILQPDSALDQNSALLPPPPSQQPCTDDLAGHGERRAGACYDMIAARARGPVMVVLPAGGAFGVPFAIGKYEVAVSDFNNYCKLSGACTALEGRGAAMPVSGIGVDQARGYAEWLSMRTGHKYRLPTDAEWTYAAQAGGEQPRKDYNCRVEQGGDLIKGQTALEVNTGTANGWGLHHYIGNMQEWVERGATLTVRGGAFEDAFSACGIETEKPHGGGADRVTGFRLVMDMQP